MTCTSPLPFLVTPFSDPAAFSTSIKVSYSSEVVSRAWDKPDSQYYGVAIATLLFYDYFLTLRDEVCVFVRLRAPLLTSPPRYGMRGRGRSRGVRYPGSDGSGYRIESRKVFGIFIMVRLMASTHTQSTSAHSQSRTDIYQWCI